MDASQVIQKLSLIPLEPEGGFFAQTYKSDLNVTIDKKTRRLTTAIYYLVTGEQFSAFHRLKSVEIYHHYAGLSVELYLLSEDGKLNKIILGDKLENGEVPQVVVPAGTWQAARIGSASKKDWALLGTTVSPGFEFEDFEMAPKANLLDQFPEHKMLIHELARD